MAIEGSPVRQKIKNFNLVEWYKSCVAWILGDHPQSLKILMFDSVLVLRRKGEKEFVKLKKILKFNANKQFQLWKY